MTLELSNYAHTHYASIDLDMVYYTIAVDARIRATYIIDGGMRTK
ncbi:hypothetical protein OROHE_016407 [Orobanche hederae]